MWRARDPFRPFVLALVLFALLLIGSTIRAASHAALTGVARDPLGHTLKGVEVFVLPAIPAAVPLAVVRTDGEGRYVVADLAPGLYRVAGIKEGYLIFLANIDTVLEQSIDLLLRPRPHPAEQGGDTQPESESWALRLPDRSLLRETDAKLEGQGGTRVATPGFYEIFQGQVDQLFELGGLLPRVSGWSSDVQGMETRMRLGGSLGERGNGWLEARRESLDAASAPPEEFTSAARKAAAAHVNVSYDPTRDTNLAIRGFYSRHDLVEATSAPGGAPGLREAERSWGCRTKWSKQLSGDSRLAVRLEYLESAVELPASRIEPAGAQGSAERGRTFANRGMGAEGSYESVTAERHRVHVGLRAQLLDLPLPLLRVVGEDTYGGVGSTPGLSVGLNAQDAWSVSNPLTILYGLGYRQGLNRASTSLIVPKFGGIWSEEQLQVRWMVSYYAASSGRGLPAAELVRPVHALGYEGEAQVPLPFGLRLKGTVSYAPAQYDAGREPLDNPYVPHPIYVTDGNAEAREATFGLERVSAGTTAFLQFTQGMAEGILAPTSPLDRPVSLLADRRLRYSSSRAGVRVALTGTDVVAEFRRIEEQVSRDGDPVSPPPPRAYVELRLTQDLLRQQPSGTSWRLLVVARSAYGGEGSSVGFSPRTSDAAGLAFLNRQVSAGVSVAF